MPVTQTIPPPAPPAVVAKIKVAITSLSAVISQEVNKIEIHDAQGYAQADALFSRIRDARATVTEKLAPILTPLEKVVKEGKAALKAAQALHTELDSPLERAENTVRLAMRDYKLLEARQQEEADRKAEEEQRRLEQEAEDKLRKAEAAKTPQMQRRLTEQAVAIQTKAQQASAAPLPAPVRVAGSTTRKIRRWRVSDIAVAHAAWVQGSIPADVFDVDHTAVANYSLDDIAKWPGFEVYTDVSIIKR